ncbi:NAD-dependent epimerase/dehydratase family protein [Terasakiella sp. A23]|uniref:NAD-dependent epimerase/dehydratase family protein n=1 Tax=Terasakiella sp. FCG-A23 TaxID=3080561 RepID=UPI00295573F7|nr:NAD-dependent epimerase/dehydratase family protein [Terasakiella sp. A23]MDV7341625.1 NAD-dependent epimerase/dehydratase family protein [Terasakiella sp. A23]
MKVGILGGGGRIGIRLAQWLVKNTQWQVAPLVRNQLSLSHLQETYPEARVVDVFNDDEPFDGCDIVLNLARIRKQPGLDAKLNEELTSKVLSKFNGKLFVQFSSIEIYGALLDEKTYNLDCPKPNTGYGLEKLTVEKVCQMKADSPAKRVSLRVGNVFGSNLLWSSSTFNQCLKGVEQIPFDGNLPSNAIHISHLGKIIFWLGQNIDQLKPYEIFNANNSPALTWREFFDAHSSALKAQPLKGMKEEHSQHIYDNLRSKLNKNPFLSAITSLKNSGVVSVKRSKLKESDDFKRSAVLILNKVPDQLAKSIFSTGKKAVQLSGSGPGASVATSEAPWLYSNLMENDQRMSVIPETSLEDISLDLQDFAQNFLPSLTKV